MRIQLVPFLLGIIGFILVFATSHLDVGSKRREKALSSFMLFVFSIPAVAFFGLHMCVEGNPPPFVIYATATLSASVPWIIPAHPWWIRGLIAIILSCGILTASYLTSSNHSESITGNPNYASQRFWHTFLTGQYPRNLEKMEAFQQE